MFPFATSGKQKTQRWHVISWHRCFGNNMFASTCLPVFTRLMSVVRANQESWEITLCWCLAAHFPSHISPIVQQIEKCMWINCCVRLWNTSHEHLQAIKINFCGVSLKDWRSPPCRRTPAFLWLVGRVRTTPTRVGEQFIELAFCLLDSD